MRIAKSLFPWIMIFSMVFLVPFSFAENEYVLMDGSRAVIIERQLVLIRWDGKRSLAAPGSYETRDGRYTIDVGGKGAVVQDRSMKLR
jgi:hypothetical protein